MKIISITILAAIIGIIIGTGIAVVEKAVFSEAVVSE